MKYYYLFSWMLFLTAMFTLTSAKAPTGSLKLVYSAFNPNGALDIANYDLVSGWALDQSDMNQTVTVDIYVDGNLVGSTQANTDRQDLVGAFGNSAARYHGFSYRIPANASWRNGQGHSIAVHIRGASTDVMSSPKTINGCSGGTTNPTTNPPNPPSGNCAFSEGQFLLNWYGEQIYAHYVNGILYAAYQNGNEGFKPQNWMQATGFDPGKVSCFAVNDPHTTTTNNPTTNPPTNPPSGNCAYSEGQFLLNWYGEQIYAHYFNGTLYAAYQDGNVGFKPRSWLSDTGYEASKLACFAQNDPHTTTTTNPPTNNPPINTNSSPARAGGNFVGSLDVADCNGISGWIANKNTPNKSTKLDVYINGWLVAVGVPAILTRQDVANALGISGYNAFGFYVPIQKTLKRGSTLNISVKYHGTQTDIPGSPRTTATCPVDPLGCSNDGAGRIAQAESPTYSRTDGLSLKLSGSGSSIVSSLTSKLIPVKKGDNFSLDAYAYAPILSKPNYTPQRTTALVGGILAGVVLTQSKDNISESGHSIKTTPSLGVSSVLMIPLVKSLLEKRLPDASVELAFYNLQGRFIHRQQVSITKNSRLDWQQLHIEGYAKDPGYIAVRLKNSSRSPVWFDDLSFQTGQQRESGSANKRVFVPKATTSLNSFDPQQLITTESIYRNCTMEDDPTVNGGQLVVDATVVGHYNSGGYDYGNWGWGSGSSGSTGSTGSDGGSSSGGSTTFTPNNAPQSPKVGDAYTSQSKVTYIWDGKSWCIVIKPVDVIGRPTNPTNQQLYFYTDPDFGYTTVYEYVSGRWTMPMVDYDMDNLPKPLKNAIKSSKDDGCKTFKAMWNRQNNDTHVEQIAFITDKGVFWLSDADNKVNSSEMGAATNYSGDPGKKWFIKDNIVYNILATVHTHPVGSEWNQFPSVKDMSTAKSFGIPDYIISVNGIYKVDNMGNNLGIVDYNNANLFNCDLDQNIVVELR